MKHSWIIKKLSVRVFLVDQIPNSLNQNHKYCVAVSKESNLSDLGSETVNRPGSRMA